MFIFTLEDKIVFILIILVLILVKNKSYLLTGFLIGIFTGLNGVAISALPILLIDVTNYRCSGFKKIKHIISICSSFCLGLIVMLIPFFPESLIGWSRRSNLEGEAIPSFYSIWRIMENFYFSNLNKMTIFLLAIFLYINFYRKKLDFRESLVLVYSLFFVFSVNTVPQRLFPIMLILFLCFRANWSRILYSLILFFHSTIMVVFYHTNPSFSLLDHILTKGYPERYGATRSFFLLFPILSAFLIILVEKIDNARRPDGLRKEKVIT
jgi:hypothetical protein